MTEPVRDWILGLTAAALVTGAALSVTPKGRVRKVLSLLCGVVMALSFLSPVMRFDWETYSNSLAGYRARMQAYSDEVDYSAGELSRTIIERELGAYILDKAQTLGVDIASASVKVRWADEGIWYPYEATIAAAEESQELAGLIESELGIPETRQYWSDADG